MVKGFDFFSSVENAPAQFVYDIVEMTDCILEAINSSIQAYINALTGRLCPSISRPLVGLRKMIHGFALLGGSALIGGANGLHLE